jgi:hypothetical protein
MNNNRGISILPFVAKLFENYCPCKSTVISKTTAGQHGFRKNASCETALHKILSDVYKNLDKKLINMLLF